MARRPKKPRNTSVENTGPAGYEYQYLVTVWLILRLWEGGLEAGWVEGGREDTTLNLRTPEGPYRLEVQVKSEKGGITVHRLARWLTHFPSRSANDSLLEWLQGSDQGGIVFVTAGRVDNALIGLLASNEQGEFLVPRKRPTILLPQAKALREALGNCYKKSSPTKLDRERQQYCSRLAKRLRLEDLKHLSQRIFVLEQLSPEKVQDEAGRLLNGHFRIPQSETVKVLGLLVGRIPEARENGLDLVPLFRKILQEYIQPRIFAQQVHVERGSEPKLVAELRSEGVLLLTGPMLCGKTHTGRSVAQVFQNVGFACRETGDTDEAKRFLLDLTTPEDRLVLLEDPFGKIALKEDAYEKWEAVGSLVADLRTNRKLIISCRRDILQSLVKGVELRLDGKNWRDLALTDPAKAVEIWRAHALNQDPRVVEDVAEGLASMEPGHLLQPGQIRFLARRDPETLKDLSFQQLLRVARYQAPDIGQRLVSQGSPMQETLAALALSATTLSRVSLEELRFILGDSEGFPGKIELEFGRMYGGYEQPLPQFPVYGSLSALASRYRETLDELEARGLVEQGGGYRFSHPIYEQASFEAFRALPRFQFEKTVQLARRAMFSLSSATAKNSVETVHRLRREEDSPERREELTELGLNAFTSIFPGVRDASMRRFVEDFESLGVDFRKRLLRIVRSQWLERKNILWYRGEPWFDTRDSIPFSDSSEEHFTSQFVANAQEKLRSLGPGERLPAEQIWGILRFYDESQSGVIILERALSYDEALIRSEAAYLLLRYHDCVPRRLLERVAGDPDPTVIAEAIRGFLMDWERRDEAACAAASSVLFPALGHPSRAILAAYFLTHFEDVTGRYDGANPWRLWAGIASPVLRGLPRHYHVNEGSLYRMFSMAIPSLDKAEALEVLKAWLEWIEGALRERLPEDYGLGVADLLLMITGRDAEARREFLPRLLAQTETSFRVTVVSDLANGWDNLNDVERKEVLETIRQPSVDQRWVQAAALTVRNPPWDIIEFILGDAAVLLLPEGAILERFPPELLEACLSMHTGHPQPLGWIGLHHRASELWEPLLLWIARNPRRVLFDLAIRELLLNASNRDEESGRLDIWRELAQKADVATCKRLFGHLLRWTARITAVPFQAYWEVLLQSPEAEQLLPSWYETIFEALHDIEEFDNLNLFLRLPGFLEALLERFPEDLAMLEIVDRPLTPAGRELLMEQYENNPPKLLRVHDKVLSVLGGDLNSPDPIVQKVVQVRREWFKQKSWDNDPWDDHYKIQDWIWAR